MNIHTNYIHPIGVTISREGQKSNLELEKRSSFKNHLDSYLQPETTLSISKHAKHRIQERNIHISGEEWQQIVDKVQLAKQMGVKESLVLLNDAALIVSATNNTVITAMNREEARTQIFTNINGTIII